MYNALIDALLVDITSRVSLLVADFIVAVVTRSITNFHRRESVLHIAGTRMTIASVLYKYGANSRFVSIL